ncbi:MAG TPA: hypothetical protein VJU16_07860 [Planctomycetota bacterium]|nr:hypothetical protein [Planctomycetota bacterium]
MRRARRWFAAVVGPLLMAGCTTTSDVGGDGFTPDDALWVGVYVGVFVLGVVAANIFVEAHE